MLRCGIKVLACRDGRGHYAEAMVPSRPPAKHPAFLALEAAPYDDEPLSEAEARELDEARAEVERGEVVSHEEVRRLWLKRP